MDRKKDIDIWELVAADVHHEADENEKEELDRLTRKPDNEKIQQEIRNLHEKLKETRPLQNTSLYHSWESITRQFRKKKVSLFLTITKYAAIILLAFGAGTFFHVNWKKPAEVPPVYTEVIVPLGQMSEMTLVDGTHVWLNSGTKLRYASNFGETSRNVELIGEAFFKVERDEVPFRVKIKDNEIEVLGTSFAAVSYPDEEFSQVTLVKGSVQIIDKLGRRLRQLHPRQQLNIPDDPSEKITIAEVNTTFYESWINGEIRFDNERLSDVARRMERWYNVEIRFASEEARNVRFTGTILKNKPIDQSIRAISMLLSIETKYENNLDTKDIIIISKK